MAILREPQPIPESGQTQSETYPFLRSADPRRWVVHWIFDPSQKQGFKLGYRNSDDRPVGCEMVRPH